MFKIFEYMTEVMGWLRIVVSPLLVGIVIGALVYFSKPDTTRLLIGVSIVILGLIVGIIWATKVWKKKGTINFLTEITATPDLDKTDNDSSEV